MYLIPVQYSKKKYPNNITPKIQEIAGHFDVCKLEVKMPYSLHTEYSYSKRKMNSEILRRFNTIKEATEKGIPLLWFSKEWAIEFANFIIILTNNLQPPTIIEIHPPFSNYSTLDKFIEDYKFFEDTIKTTFTNITILIENRYGSFYNSGKFIISDTQDLIKLVEKIQSNNINLRITLDIPQVLAAHSFSIRKRDMLIPIFNTIKNIRDYIYGIHLWGKTTNGVSHAGDLNTFFKYDFETKILFLECLKDTFNDEIKRYFVPEVNSSEEDLISIINDLQSIGSIFI